MRRIATGVLVLAIAALAAACDADLSPGATVLQAVSETSRAGSARVSYRASFDIAAAGDVVDMTGQGVFDYAHQKGHMTFDMSEVIQGGAAPSPDAAEVEMIFEGVVLYMKMPFLTQVLSAERPWLRLDLDAARRAGRQDLAQLVQLGESDPTQVMELLRGAEAGVDDLGRESVRGEPTTHYGAVLDLVRAAKDASDGARPSMLDLIARSGSKRLKADVWIDDEGRMRKLTYGTDLASSQSSPAGRNRMTVTMELYEFGVNVVVHPPPADQVVDLLQLLQQSGGSP